MCDRIWWPRLLGQLGEGPVEGPLLNRWQRQGWPVAHRALRDHRITWRPLKRRGGRKVLHWAATQRREEGLWVLGQPKLREARDRQGHTTAHFIVSRWEQAGLWVLENPEVGLLAGPQKTVLELAIHHWDAVSDKVLTEKLPAYPPAVWTWHQQKAREKQNWHPVFRA